MMGKTLIPDTGYDVTWTQLGRGAFNGRRLQPGVSPRQFINKLRMTNSVPISQNTVVNLALIGENEHRALFIAQNNSTATSPDSAPTFYFGFGSQPKVGFDLALPPGVGIVLDVRVPADAVYVDFGPYSNTNNTVVIQGVVKEGGVTDAVGDNANVADSAQLGDLVTLLKRALGMQ